MVRLAGADRLWPMEFWGIPTGFVLDGLVEAMEALTGAMARMDWSETIQHTLFNLPRPVSAQLFVGATCSFCHPMIHRAIQVAALQARVTFDVIPVDQFPDVAEAARIRSTPSLYDPTTGQTLAANVPPAHLAAWLYQTAFSGLPAGAR